jgi:hypothetical protein
MDVKKRRVERATRLPTKDMATACWEFIVAKSNRPEPAPMLVFRPLQGANSKSYQQIMNRLVWAPEGIFRAAVSAPKVEPNILIQCPILALHTGNAAMRHGEK